jgi:hypothetical protein
MSPSFDHDQRLAKLMQTALAMTILAIQQGVRCPGHVDVVASETPPIGERTQAPIA